MNLLLLTDQRPQCLQQRGLDTSPVDLSELRRFQNHANIGHYYFG